MIGWYGDPRMKRKVAFRQIGVDFLLGPAFERINPQQPAFLDQPRRRIVIVGSVVSGTDPAIETGK